MAIRKIQTDKPRKSNVSRDREIAEIIAFRKANAAYADSFFAKHNLSGDTPRKKSTIEQDKQAKTYEHDSEETVAPDYSFAKHIVESYHDNKSYISENSPEENSNVISESQIKDALEVYRRAKQNTEINLESGLITEFKEAAQRGLESSPRARSENANTGEPGKFSVWLEDQAKFSEAREAELRAEIQERREQERYILVEELAADEDYDYFTQYEQADYSSDYSEELTEDFQFFKESDFTANSNALVRGTLALEPVADEALLKRLEKMAETEREAKEERSRQLEELNERLNLKKIYRAIGLKRMTVMLTSLAVVLSLAAVFISLLIRQANIVEMNFELASQKERIAELAAANQQTYERIMSSYDLQEVKEKAASELGLRAASQAQRIHIYLPEADRCILYSDDQMQDAEIREDIIAYDYLNYHELEKYFDGVKGLYE
ncbi:MAG: hypothetical protein Q4P65_02930 [Eubacteriales bacterium]|nr:hypothetical protein [Eubacteriales bacterium]